MSDLVDFLTARLAEDEQVARAASPGPWRASESYTDAGSVDGPDGNIADESHTGDVRVEDAEHIARHHPARVLAEVAAKRRIVELHGAGGDVGGGLEYCESCGSGEPNEYPTWLPCDTQRLLALPYAEHPDYRDEWKP